ncbi:MAG TPA: TonB family protein [Dyadobacter sp.]|nr:TonB family protein [Dyadobacter sp.]
MKRIFIIFLFCFSSVFAQNTYQSHEVDTQATPSGGQQLLNHFISSNLNIPIRSSFKGINARVFINAIVETDGSVSNVSVLKGGDSLMNAEAIRVVQLYKAWKPAVLKEVAVRQAVSLPVVFKSAPVSAYDSTSQSLVAYFDKNWITTPEKEKQKFRRFIPVDHFGMVNGDVLFEKIEDGKWNALGNIPFTKKELWKKNKDNQKTDSTKVFVLSAYYEVGNQPIYQFIQKGEKGNILEFRQFGEDNKVVLEKYYHDNGILREMNIHGNDIRQRTYWYDNGQLAGIFDAPTSYEGPSVSIVRDYYDKNGSHMVKNSNGHILDHQQSFPGIDGRGEVKNGLKEGLWISKSENGTLLYEEHYSKGNLTKGTSYRNGEKFEYTQFEVQPEFAGGLPSMYNYLATNIKYPQAAAKKNIQGRVFTTFVVCEDGTLCDFEILQGLDKNIDNEALRVIEGMSGKWKPGWQRGQKVRVKYNLPINFQLN